MNTQDQEWSITYKQIGVIIVSFLLGMVFPPLANNASVSEATTFSTSELIGFVLTVILSGASIVLAIAAIALGKSSERAVLERSDESIRLQTEVFTKTTDALQSIKASTGVTEKRIEDIISGRVGDISRQIAETVSDDSRAGSFDIEELKEKIRASIVGTIEKTDLDERKDEELERRKKSRERRRIYEKAHDELMYALANKEHVKILKLGHGSPLRDTSSPWSRYDAVFKKEDKTIAISTTMPSKDDQFVLRRTGDIISSLASSILEDGIDKVYVIFFEEEEGGEVYQAAKKSQELLNESLASRVHLACVTYDQVEKSADGIEL